MRYFLYFFLFVVAVSAEGQNSDECDIVKIGESEKQAHDVNSSIVDSNKSDRLDICVYNSGISLVKDIRALHLKKGMNVVYLYDISPILELNSVRLSCVECSNDINVLSYELLRKQMSKVDVLKSSIGNQVFFLNAARAESVGVLRDVVSDKEPDTSIAVIHSNGKVMFIPVSDCSYVLQSSGLVRQNAIKSHIYSKSDVDVKLELQYITSGISWRPEYRLEVNENISTAAIYTNAMLKNGIDWDIKEASVVFEPSAPSLKPNERGSLPGAFVFKCTEKLSLKRDSSTVIAMEDCVKVPVHSGSLVVLPEKKHNDKELKVDSIATFDIGHLERVNYIKPDDAIGVYSASSEYNHNFLGIQCLRGLVGDGEAAVRTGEAVGVTARIIYFDVRYITNKIYEMSISVRINNNKSEKTVVYVVDKQNGARLIKENHKRIAQDGFVWKLIVDANASLDLFYKVRVDKNDGSSVISR